MIIDKEFADLIPPLTEEEYRGLEASIVAEGCRDALIAWKDTLVDGHNRFKICTEHGIAFQVLQKDFADRDAVKLWMLGNQLGRRNLNDFQRIEMVRKCEDAVKARAKERQAKYYGNQYESGLEIKISQVQNTEPSLESSKEGLITQKPENDCASLAEKNKADAVLSARNVGTHVLEREPARKVCSEDTKRHPQVRDELGKMAGVSGSTYEHAAAILDNAPQEVIRAVRNGEVSINKAYTDLRKAERKAERQAAIAEQLSKPKMSNHVDIFATDKKYRVIYADPPWAYGDKQDTEKLGGAVKHYPTMPLEDICALPVPTERNAVLFLWTTSPMLENAFKVVNAWGFRYKSSFVWDKVSHNMGHYNSVRHELLLVCVKGSCMPDVPKLYDSVVSIERMEHSRKPEEFRQMIDNLYPIGERLEMFAREASEGWDVWGNMV